jgi:hypothetical protein
MSYITLRGGWCDISFLNVHAPTEDEIDDVTDRFYEELDRVYDKFPKYHMKMLLGNFSAKVGREDIFNSTVGNQILTGVSNYNGFRVVNFVTSKNLIFKSTMFTRRNIHELTSASTVQRLTIKLTIFW